MRKQKISYNWPAILCSFSKDETQGNFSRGKLKVFYIGETDDHRFFSKKFAENLVKSLPYTPIVSYYDEDEEDFVGHNRHQNIYGIVDPKTEIAFEEDEQGKTWVVCDVVYYTERPDETGEIAKKIVGHKHSLELDPNTIEYIVNYDDKKHFKNIEFTAGTFVGVSVLGDKQKPAFAGSEFFTESDFEVKMNILKNFCETGYYWNNNNKDDDDCQNQLSDNGNEGRCSDDNNNNNNNHPTQINGGSRMDFNQFIKLSFGEISLKVEEAIRKDYQETAYTQLVDLFEDNAIVRFYFYVEEVCKLERIYYSCDENGNVTLGGINEVHIIYEDVNSAAATTENDNQTSSSETAGFTAETEEEDTDLLQAEVKVEEQPSEENPSEEASTEEVFEEEEGNNEEGDNEADDEVDFTEASNDASDNNNDNNNNTPQEESVTNETAVQEDDSSFTAHDNSAAEELAAAKRAEREEKIKLINSFTEALSKEQLVDFMSRVDDYEDIRDLKIDLLEFKNKRSEETAQAAAKVQRIFATASASDASRGMADNRQAGDPLDASVRKYLKK